MVEGEIEASIGRIPAFIRFDLFAFLQDSYIIRENVCLIIIL
jgi:hypothetical protein